MNVEMNANEANFTESLLFFFFFLLFAKIESNFKIR